MTKSEEYFIYFGECIASLNNALNLLNEIDTQRNNSLAEPAFRYALVEYCKPYSNSYGLVTKRNQLGLECIPKNYVELHNRILDARNQIHAHSDLTIKEATIDYHQYDGKTNILISGNYLTGI